MTHKIQITRKGRGAEITPGERAVIKRAAAAVVELEGYPPSQITLLYATDAEMRKINAETRGVDATTDVLSFPNLNAERGFIPEAQPWDMENGLLVLGDVVISIDRARAQAEEYGHSVERELAFLTVHAVLHLMGYDHEESLFEEKQHFKRQKEILTIIGEPR